MGGKSEGTRKRWRCSVLERVVTKVKSLQDYVPLLVEGQFEEIAAVARELQGVRVLHLNSTAAGGGVAELLKSLVPLEEDCGLQVEWRIMSPDNDFFEVTKGFHNALQSQPYDLTPERKATYLNHNQSCSRELTDEFDVIIVHDPQPAAMRRFVGTGRARWVWRCHIDTSSPHPPVWDFLKPYIEQYDAAVFTKQSIVSRDFAGPRTFFIPPAIDPLSPKNRVLPRHLCREEVAEFGVDLTRPLIVQVARFDPWKDPQGVIEAYRLVKQEIPGVQLAMIGAMATDDPQGWEIYANIRDQGEGDPDLFLFTNLMGVGAHEVNAFQRVADVAIQKSIREGFGLVVSEALWKSTPVVGGNTGGIPLQMEDGVGGFLVNSVEEAAERTLYLLSHPDEAEIIARRGWRRVQERYLMPRLLLDELRLIHSLLEGQGSSNHG